MIGAMIGTCGVFIGSCVVGYVFAMNGPEDTPGGGIAVETLVVRSATFALGVTIVFCSAMLGSGAWS